MVSFLFYEFGLQRTYISHKNLVHNFYQTGKTLVPFGSSSHAGFAVIDNSFAKKKNEGGNKILFCMRATTGMAI
jgi:hypothetical protein